MDQLKAALAVKRLGDQPKAYSIAQFCAIYNVGRTRAFEEIRSGRLKSYQVGRCRHISVRAADQWQADREAGAV